jgi:hypothetical protein
MHLECPDLTSLECQETLWMARVELDKKIEQGTNGKQFQTMIKSST